MIWVALIFIAIGILIAFVKSNNTDALFAFFMAVGVSLILVWSFK